MRHIVHSDLKGDLLHQTFKYQQDTDPTLEVGNTVMAGDFWLNTSTNHLEFRNNTNTAWVII